MLKVLQSKKGFTIVELVSVLLLLSLGALALANLFTVAFTAFDKSSERYEKQETAKLVARYLQSGGAALSSATKVELYNDINVVPTTAEKGYNYLYVDPADGCLYIRPSGEDAPTKLTDVQIYMSFDPIPYKWTDQNGVTHTDINKSRAVKCTIAVLEDDAQIQVVDNKFQAPHSDDIYYELEVAYHFPNMVENDKLYVNRALDEGVAGIAYTNAKTVRDGEEYLTVQENANIVKYVTDLTVSGDQLMNDSNFDLYCFIATASYGVNNGEGVVGLLCDFRDNVLLTNPLGEAFVKAYYKLSPPVADIIAESEPLKEAVRFALKPLVVVAVNALDEDVASQSAPWFAAFMLCGAGSTAMIIRITKRRKKEAKN